MTFEETVNSLAAAGATKIEIHLPSEGKSAMSVHIHRGETRFGLQGVDLARMLSLLSGYFIQTAKVAP